MRNIIKIVGCIFMLGFTLSLSAQCGCTSAFSEPTEPEPEPRIICVDDNCDNFEWGVVNGFAINAMGVLQADLNNVFIAPSDTYTGTDIAGCVDLEVDWADGNGWITYPGAVCATGLNTTPSIPDPLYADGMHKIKYRFVSDSGLSYESTFFLYSYSSGSPTGSQKCYATRVYDNIADVFQQGAGCPKNLFIGISSSEWGRVVGECELRITTSDAEYVVNGTTFTTLPFQSDAFLYDVVNTLCWNATFEVTDVTNGNVVDTFTEDVYCIELIPTCN